MKIPQEMTHKIHTITLKTPILCNLWTVMSSVADTGPGATAQQDIGMGSAAPVATTGLCQMAQCGDARPVHICSKPDVNR